MIAAEAAIEILLDDFDFDTTQLMEDLADGYIFTSDFLTSVDIVSLLSAHPSFASGAFFTLSSRQ